MKQLKLNALKDTGLRVVPKWGDTTVMKKHYMTLQLETANETRCQENPSNTSH